MKIDSCNPSLLTLTALLIISVCLSSQFRAEHKLYVKEGIRRSSKVLPSLPHQKYEFSEEQNKAS